MNLINKLGTCILLIASLALSAQDADSSKSQTRTFQLSFATPLGTNGLNSWDITNKFSINILTGYAGGLNGTEFTSLVSVLKSDMRGAQFSGLGHLVLGEIKGAQFSGLFNIGLKSAHAWQFAGFINLVTKETKGLQCGGFTNIVTDSLSGVQISGFGNVATRRAKGFQASGFGNYAKGGKVTQMSGFTNITIGNNTGLQITGFGNINTGEMKGVQIAGATNINAGHLKGMQISGLFNFARKFNGVQIAPFNYVDSLERGVPIGVLSFVRNGYIGVEFAATETMYGVFSFKTGVKKFYNILSVGAAYRDNMIVWGWGYGLGGMIPLAEKWDLSIEGLCYQMNEGEWFTNRLNLLNKLQVAASWKLTRGVTLVGGLSWNVTVSDITDEYGDPVTPHIAPWEVYDQTNGNINIKMYPGITAGIRL
jgi:hypothetical protein